MPNKSIKAIVWDLDGTLIHFKIDFIRARKNAIKILKENGIDGKKLPIKNSILENLKISRAIFKELGYSSQRIESVMNEVNETVNQIEYEAAIKAKMIKGIDDVLEFAKRRRLKQAIYTFNSYRNAKVSLKKVNLLKYFDVIVGRDDVANPKPHPDHLIKICNKLGVETSQVVVIGDHARDIEGAHNVDAHSIALHTRLAQIKTLQMAEKIVEETELPAKLIKAIEELL